MRISNPSRPQTATPNQTAAMKKIRGLQKMAKRKPVPTRAGDGVQNAFVNNFVNNRPKGTKMARGVGDMGRAEGGMISKKGYAKGGMVKANCGASMKPNRKAKK